MKYAVLTAKHVAGHCLWDSKVQFRGKEFDHDVATSGCKTDVVAEFVKACKKHDVAPGLYWCLLDLRNNTDMDANHVEQAANAKIVKKKQGLTDGFLQLAKDQFTELIQRYPEVGYYWIDIPRAATAAERQEMYDIIKRLRPGTVVLFNNGCGTPDGEMTIAKIQAAWPTDVLGTERHPLKPGQFTPDQTWQGKLYRVGYEHCDTIHRRWFWVEGDQPRPVNDLYKLYQRVRAGGGNFLLNVPPDRTGRIADYDVKALMELEKAIDDPSIFPAPLTSNAKVTASNYYRNDATYRSEAAVDANTGTRWATDDGTKSAWLEVDLGKPATVGRAVIEQAYPELKRVKKFAIEYRDGDEWKTCYRGENLGATLNAKFEPITAQHFRLNITESTDGPTIWEFQLFAPIKETP
jgi:alpha-L-fucosidase